MLILGFLRSVVHCLAQGPIPTSNLPRKRNMPTDGDDDDDEGIMYDATTEDMGTPSSSTAQCSRGKVLITLRNVPPYSIWRVHPSYHSVSNAYVDL